VVDIPFAIPCGFFGKGLKCGFNGFKGNNPALVSAVSQRLAELANVRSHIDDQVDLTILDKIDQVPYSPPPKMDDPEAFVNGPNYAIHWLYPSAFNSNCAPRRTRRGDALTQFEGGECKQCKHQGADPETDNDLGFTPAELLEVMMERGHFKDALAVAQFVAAHLENH